MTKKDDEEKKTWVALAGKIAVAVLGALAAGGAGSLATTETTGADPRQEERITHLETSCQAYDVRLATAETKLGGVEVNMMDIKKDLADIRSTSTQILLMLRRER